MKFCGIYDTTILKKIKSEKSLRVFPFRKSKKTNWCLSFIIIGCTDRFKQLHFENSIFTLQNYQMLKITHKEDIRSLWYTRIQSPKQVKITRSAEELVFKLLMLEEFLFIYLAIYLFEIERTQVSGIKFYTVLDKKMMFSEVDVSRKK